MSRWIACASTALVLAVAQRGDAQQRPDAPSPLVHGVLPYQIVYDTSSRLYGSQSTPRSLGASIGVIDSSVLATFHTHSLSEVLAARIPGVSVLRSSGIVGTGSRVRVRGASGFFAPREPIVLLDGVRIDAAQNTSGLTLGGQQPSRLDDIDVDQIARIEVLRGPAASALYGTDGAGGVIRITTRTPNQGGPAWTTYAEGALSTDVTQYPANYSTGSGVVGEPTCTRATAAVGTCSPGPLLSWNPLENASPFRTATRARAGTSVNGGWRRLGYLVSGSVQHEQGVIEPNDATRLAARLNADAHPFRALDLALRSSYTRSRTALPFSNGAIGVLAAGLLGNAIDDPVNRGYRSDALSQFADVPTEERMARTMGSLIATWRPARWLSARAIAGTEIARRDDARSTALMLGPPAPPGDLVRFEGSTGRDSRATLSANTTASFHLGRSLLAETTVGIERLSSSRRTTDSSVVRDQGGIAASDFVAVRTTSHVTGLIATERLNSSNRRFIGVGLRRDRTTLSAFGPATFFSADAAWVIADEPFFPHSGIFTGLRLRGAYGRSADYRLYAFAPSSSPFPFTGDAAFRLPSETISEAEVGIDAFLFRRLWVETTWYRQHSADALTVCCFDFPPAANGVWHTTGLDAVISANLVRSLGVEWSARLDISAFANRVDDVGQGRRVQSVGPTLVPRARFANVVGHPIAGIWGNRLRVHDNGDGIITSAEVDVAPDSSYLGSSFPTREIGLTSTLSFRRVTIAVLLDYRGGFRQINATADNRCELEICGALYDPDASLSNQARAISVDRAGAGFVEDASFLRLRELNVTWKLLPGWIYRHGVARLDATVAGSNLLTFTGYSGLDPEINYRGQTGLGSAEFYTLPLPRSISIRLDVTPR